MLNRSILAVAVFASLAVPSFAAEVELRETACRLLDTRHIGGYNSGSKVTALTIEATDPDLDDVAFTVSGRDYNYQGGEAGCRVSAGAMGAKLNVVLFSPNSVGNATLWPDGVAQPFSTSINSSGSLNEVSGLEVTLGTGGRILLNSTITGAHYVIDYAGDLDAGGQAGVEAPRHRRFLTWTNAPFAPGAVTAGDRFLVAESGGVGAFAGHEGEWAVWNGEAWDFEAAEDGDLGYDASSGAHWFYRGLGMAKWMPLKAQAEFMTEGVVLSNQSAGSSRLIWLDGKPLAILCAQPYIDPADCGATEFPSSTTVWLTGHIEGEYIMAHRLESFADDLPEE